MKRKGFTLIELLAVIIIISVLLLIVVPAVTSAIEGSKDKLYDVAVSEIVKAAKQYTVNYSNEIEGLAETGRGYVTLEKIIDKGILEPPVKNPKTGNGFDLGVAVKVVKEDNAVYHYTFLIDGIPSS